MAEIAVNLLAKKLKELLSSKIDLSLEEKDQIQTLYEDLQLLRTNLNDLQVKFFEHEQVKNLEARIRDLAYEAENTIDSFLVNIFSTKNIKMKEREMAEIDLAYERIKTIKKDRSLKDEIKEDGSLKPEIQHGHSLNLEHVKEEIEAIKTEMMEIYDTGLEGILQVGSCSSSGDSDSSNTKTWGVGEEEIMVGFEDEAMSLKEQLTGGPKQLQVISIVGMAGQGKTTLATKLYNDPLVVYHFYIRAWTSVSQEYRKRDLLIRLLSCVMKHTNGIDQMGDEKLCEKLYKSLKGQTYFIVMDDMWDTKAWVDLKICFPNDNNGSRIMFTSRHEDVALQAKTNNPPLSLRFLTHNESWDLFQHKVFGKRENCPPVLVEIGKQITNKCQGLPLSIVVVAGIFINEEKSQDRWKQVGETLKSSLAANPQACMKTLALSYIHLPGHLKPCFLYFGAFPEDFQIPVWKLIWLWILLYFGAFPEDYQIRVEKLIWLWVAEGFITKTGEKRLKDVAKEYLMDLIGRSLLLVSKRGYDGEIKACGIHDLLREFCIKQGEDDFFLQHDLPLSDNLQTLSWVFCQQEFSVRISNLKKLGLCGRMVHEKSLMFPDLYFLDHLQALKLWNEGIFNQNTHVLGRIKLPLNLTKLTLKNTHLKWDEMSTLGKSLPNLEGLKLLYKACIVKRWETSDGEFPRSKFLKLKHVQVDQLEVSSNQFPVLQRLVLIQCNGLEKIPSEMGDLPTLQMIEVHWCHPSLANSAKEIKEEQESIGNNWLQMIESNNNVL
ncbi:putative late blight resistance protein homolog R1B-16 [Camellia sinensis]|uniref:putative late blight resistance protein homolog R1B-16 n=1 Tax=Camellia sinensis TaxID=4442 RepID=UPI0010366E98|nr:putative late blight resistance protein homolog R1B-16 [Camellia sinensis]